MATHYEAMVEQVEYADKHGIDSVYLTEHHGVIDNYLPSTLVAAAAVASRTRHVRLRTMVLAPFTDPVRLAEDIAVVDLLSGGRVDPIFAAGYADFEFQMFGKDQARRRKTVDTTVQFVRRAWTEDEFNWKGRRVRVTPKPCQRPHPTITMGGMSMTAARAAARFGDDFAGMEKYRTAYRQECVAIGKPDPGPGPTLTPFIHLSEDPERDWPLMAPFLLSAISQYLEWTTTSTRSGRAPSTAFDIHTEEELRASPAHRLLTPDQAVELIDSLGDHVLARMYPGWGGQSPDRAWSSLELFTTRVVPRLREHHAARLD
jgi:alkanesulfonate monooxygenase SsuD/methylene tetrahydromethanopterin reductase-like flavin-dependent oxidoreductase (luciferase family)